MKLFITLFLIFAACVTFAYSQKSSTSEISYFVDGDTLRLKGGEYVRLIGINAPEIKDPCGLESKEHLMKLLRGKEISLVADPSQSDRDKYDRLLRYVFVGNENINLRMIKDGYAREYTYSKPYKYQKEFRAADSGIKC